MKYLINETIVFDSITGSLHLTGEENTSIQLSRPSTLLLTELIANAGKTSSREELLTNVWEKNGLIPSSNNLSNHISYLRKTFRELGLDDNVIATVPKEGFRLTIITRHHNVMRTHPAAEETENALQAPGSNVILRQKLSGSRNSVVNISLTITLLVLSISLITVIILPPRSQVAMSPFPPIGLCQMYEISADQPSYREEKIIRLKELINRNNIDCINKKSTDYFKFYHFNPEKKNAQRALFFAHCTTGPLAREHCVNFLSVTVNKP